MTTLNAGQTDAAKALMHWYKTKYQPIFRLGGSPGSGKSYTAVAALKELNLRKSHIVFCTFTGQASLVLMRYLENGDYQVSTIHNLIYDTVYDHMHKDFRFELKKHLGNARLIVVDEASMVSTMLKEALESFGLPILALGDPDQLPAIETPDKFGFIGATSFMDNPDVLLTEPMRQHKDSKILHLAALAKAQKKIDVGVYSDLVEVVRKEDLQLEDYLNVDQVICGYNSTIKEKTEDIRSYLGFESSSPSINDKVIITQNNNQIRQDTYPLTNGMIGRILNMPEIGKRKDYFTNSDSFSKQQSLGSYLEKDIYAINFKADFMTNPFETSLYVPATDFNFEKELIDKNVSKYFTRMEYGYLTSCHRAQGNQFDSLLVLDESFGPEPWRWLYTAITRAKRQLKLAI